MTLTRRGWTGLMAGFFCLSAGWLDASAATIRLNDDTSLQADVLRVDDDSVVVQLPRTQIKTINGVFLPAALTEGMAAPAFSVTDLAGQTQAIGKGAAPLTILHFWVSWCPFCRADQPVIQQLADRFKNDGRMRMMTVSLDEKREALDQFMTEHHVTYPVISAKEQLSTANGVDLPSLYQINGFPVTYLIDGQGMIQHKIGGSFVKGNVDLPALIDKLVPPAPTQ